MRMNYHVGSSQVTVSDIHEGADAFYNKFKVSPDTIKMSYDDLNKFLLLSYSTVTLLESGKKYAPYIVVPGGIVELKLLDQDEEFIAGHTTNSILVIENTTIDKEFEKIVLEDINGSNV